MASKAALQQAAEHNVTADRVLAALEAVVVRPSSAPVVADAIGAHPRTARRILRTLARSEYVERLAPSGRAAHTFHPTVRLLAMAAQLAPRLPLVQHGRDAVLRLEAVTGFGAYVAVPAYADVLVIACSGERGILPWALLPVLDDATGRMLLAHRREWRSSLAAEGRELGEGEVDETLKRGHVVVWRSGARIGSLAVAMPRPAGPPIAAIGLRGPGDELVAGERSLADLLRTAAARLARDTSDSWQPI